MLLLNGGEPDFLMGASAATFEAINHVPAFYGSRHNAGHSATYFHPGGGEFANVASNWLLWTFKGDKEAGKMFAGQELRSLHEFELGCEVERDQQMKPSIPSR